MADQIPDSPKKFSLARDPAADAALAADALPAAFRAYVASVRALRAARIDFAETATRAGEGPCAALFADGDALEALFGVMNVATNEATHLTSMATDAGSALVASGAMSEHETNVHLARGQAVEMLSCTCGGCDVCVSRAKAVAEGKDPRQGLESQILAMLEPSGLVNASGAPLTHGGAPMRAPGRRGRR